MARFCLAANMTPSEYRQLTIAEYKAFSDVIVEMNEVDE
jgi:hypothetical protein